MRLNTYRCAEMLLASLIFGSLCMIGCNPQDNQNQPETPSVQVPKTDGDRETSEAPKQEIRESNEPTATNYWGKIPMKEIGAMLSFPPELAVMDNRVISSVTGKTREITLGRPTQGGHVDLIPLVIGSKPREKTKPITEALEDARRNLTLDKQPTLDLQQRDAWPIGGGDALVIRQLIHYQDGKKLRRVKQFVWITDAQLIYLSFDAEESHYKRVSPFVSQIARTLTLTAPSTSDATQK